MKNHYKYINYGNLQKELHACATLSYALILDNICIFLFSYFISNIFKNNNNLGINAKYNTIKVR